MTAARTLEGRRALVTGAGRRLGRDIARALAAEGASLVLHCRNSEQDTRELAAELRAGGAVVAVLRADLSDPIQGGELVDRAIAEAGPLDILVNSASIFEEETLEEMSAESVHRNVDINALAPFHASRAFARQGRAGVIVNLLDTMIRDYDRKHMPYHLSKRMLFTLTRDMAVEYAPLVRVNAVAPGLVLPPEGKDESYLRDLAHTNPLNAHGSGGDVARAVLFLAASPFVTGQVIHVDGGRHLRGAMYD